MNDTNTTTDPDAGQIIQAEPTAARKHRTAETLAYVLSGACWAITAFVFVRLIVIAFVK